jgi:hypothetical protein
VIDFGLTLSFDRYYRRLILFFLIELQSFYEFVISLSNIHQTVRYEVCMGLGADWPAAQPPIVGIVSALRCFPQPAHSLLFALLPTHWFLAIEYFASWRIAKSS